jgi:hypothetical protein
MHRVTGPRYLLAHSFKTSCILLGFVADEVTSVLDSAALTPGPGLLCLAVFFVGFAAAPWSGALEEGTKAV